MVILHHFNPYFLIMNKLRSLLYLIILFVVLASCQLAPQEKKAKYVFYFIGDGMGLAQVAATEAFIASHEGKAYEPLNFREFPYTGLSTNYAANRFITGSAAAGTSLATGNKTAIGRISMDTSGTIPYESIARKAKAYGMKTGIISSASIDHPTPAVFYANQPSRYMYFEIGLDLVSSKVDFFGGGGFKQAEGELNGLKVSLPELAQDSGFNLINTSKKFKELKPSEDKVLFINPELTDGASMLYAIDQPENYITLAEITAKAIEYLDNENGFFIMVEGGKIDWLCHDNDISGMVHEVIDFSEAIEEAIKFYHQHPDETLIVVTADHETGGLALGDNTMKYETNAALIGEQDISGENFNKVLHEHFDRGMDFDEFISLLEKHFGIGTEEAPLPLTEQEKQILKTVLDSHASDLEGEYGDYSPITLRVTSFLSRYAGFGWTSLSHTGIAVPVYATGVKAEAFSGNLDNTDIPELIWDAID